MHAYDGKRRAQLVRDVADKALLICQALACRIERVPGGEITEQDSERNQRAERDAERMVADVLIGALSESGETLFPLEDCCCAWIWIVLEVAVC